MNIPMLKKIISDLKVDALLITRPENIRYLTGFCGSSSYLLVTLKRQFLVVNAIYAAEARALGLKVFESQIGKKTFSRVLGLMTRDHIKHVAYEDDFLSVAAFENLKNDLEGINLVPLGKRIEELRAVKNKSEIENIKKAAQIAGRVYHKLLNIIKPGITERDLAAEIEYWIRKEGGDRDSFEPIIASGPRSAYPHTVFTDRVIREKEFIKLDFGAKFNGYCSDLTRTLVLGKASKKQKKIYEIVKRAQIRAIEAVRPGACGDDIDRAARNIITQAGFKNNFIHSVGHGVGLEIHELPRLGKGSRDILKVGMTITVEPGIYLPDFGGVRIEDTVLVTREGAKVLTDAPKDLEI